jgi:hypothetical protein
VADVALRDRSGTGTIAVRPKLDRGFDPRTAIAFLGLLGAGLLQQDAEKIERTGPHDSELRR